jgi:hypothetical protein
MRLHPAWICAIGLLPCAGARPARAAESPHLGEAMPTPVLRTLDGGRLPFLSGDARVHVFVFFRPNQDHSLETLAGLVRCADRFQGKAVRWLGLVSSSWSADVVQAAVAASGTTMPVLVDEGDALYGRLDVRVHPTIGVADGRGRLVAYEPFRKVNQCDRLAARVSRALGETDDAGVALADHPLPALFPNEIEGAVANRHVRMGEKLLRAKLFSRTADEARLVLDRDPRHVRAHLLLAEALEAQGACGEAAASRRQAAALDAGAAAAALPRLACTSRP